MSDAHTKVRILGIAGSPRRHGNSERLLDECLDGARVAGAEIDELVVVEAGIAPCRGCNACSISGECIVRDGMTSVYPRLDAADAVVVATPVYFATVPAVLKALYDRCQPYWARRYVLGQARPARRPGGLLVVGGGGDPFGRGCAVATTRSVFAVLGLDYFGEVAAEADAPSDIGRHRASLDEARLLGAGLVTEARSRAREAP
jgi:multimeric flavodoxin WrbA